MPTVLASTTAAALGLVPEWNLPMLLLLAKATVILVAALGITLAMQRASAGARHLVWLVTLATVLLVPALAAWSPLRLEILPAPPTTVATLTTTTAGAPAATLAPTAGRVTTAAVAPRPVDHTAAPSAADAGRAAEATPLGRLRARVAGASLPAVLLAVWIAVVLALVAYLTRAALAVARIVRRARPLDSNDWSAPLYEISDRLGLEQPPRLVRSEDAKMPFACGVLRPTIVLPASCDAWTQDRREAVLLHELGHVRRHDLLGHTLGRVACALYWFHPLVWTAAKQLRAESERACDDLALACGARAADYAEHLLDIVTSVRGDATPTVALAMARRKEFEGRMLAILDPEQRRAAPSRRQQVALVASLALVAALVGAASPVARSAAAASLATRDSADLVAQRAAERDASPSRDAAATIAVSSSVARPIEQLQPTTRASSRRAHADTLPPEVAETVSATVAAAATAGADAGVAAGTTASAKVSAALSTTIASIMRGAAAQAQQGRSDPRANDERATLLANVLKSDTSARLRRVAAWGLASYADTHVGEQALATALRRDPEMRVREMAAWALASGGDARGGGAAEALAAALRGDASTPVRATAAWALGSVGGGDAVDALVAALRDSSADVRHRALWAIGSVEPRVAPPAVIAALRDSDPAMRELAAWTLFTIRDPASVAGLKAALAAEKDKGLQLEYIRALAAVGENSVDAIRQLLDSPDPEIKSMAVHALAGRDAAGPWPWPWPEPRPSP